MQDNVLRGEKQDPTKERVELSDAFFEANGPDRAKMLLQALRLSRAEQAGLERLTDFAVANVDRHLSKHDIAVE